MSLAYAQWNNKALVLREIQSNFGNGPTSPMPGARSDRQRVFADADFDFKGENVNRKFGAVDFNVDLKWKEKDNQSRDVFDVFFIGKSAAGEDFRWQVGNIIDSN